MKKIFVTAAFFAALKMSAQFMVTIKAPQNFKEQEAILYTLSGSKDVVFTKETAKKNVWIFKYPKNYMGMMKIFLPNTNNTFNFISENKNVEINLETEGDKVKNIVYLDEANSLMNNVQDGSQKKEIILPALIQIKEYYKGGSDFGKALDAEIAKLSDKAGSDFSNHPFITYYNTNYNKFLVAENSKNVSQEDIINFIDKSNDMLETSSLLRPILVSYLNIGGNSAVTASVDKLLDRLKVETPRGQTVLSELIDIFDAYDMKEFKNKYLTQAKNLKCTITDRLATTLKTHAATEIGVEFPNYKFTAAVNTQAKSLADVKADNKVVVFWSSACSHCENELPQLLAKYKEIKAKNIEIIGLSLDTDKDSYTKKIAAFPWINDSELKGWNSSFTEKYNIHATPTYFILDANNKIINKPDHVGDVLEYFKLK